MSIIIPIKGSATSGLLDVWQSHIQQQQAQKAQTQASQARTTGNAGAAEAAAGADSAKAVGAAGDAKTGNNTGNESNGDGNNNNNTNSRRIDTDMVEMVRGARDGAKQTGKAVSDASEAGGTDAIVAQTIKKLKAMLAKVMSQLDEVRNNDRLPPDEKLQMTTNLSAQAMSIQAQILALMNPTKSTGNNVDTTA